MSSHDPKIISARPDVTTAITAQTGLDHARLTELVYSFCTRVRADEMLGPIFEANISDWAAHLEGMVDFWSSVALMAGRYHGAPVPAHTPLPIHVAHFDLNLNHLTLPEIIGFNALGDESCFELKSKRYRE